MPRTMIVIAVVYWSLSMSETILLCNGYHTTCCPVSLLRHHVICILISLCIVSIDSPCRQHRILLWTRQQQCSSGRTQQRLQEAVERSALSAMSAPLTVCCICVVTCVCAMNVPSNSGGARAAVTVHSAGPSYETWSEPTSPDSGPWPHAPSGLCLSSWRQGKCNPFACRVQNMVVMEVYNVLKFTWSNYLAVFEKKSTLDLSWVLLGQKQLKYKDLNGTFHI